MKNYVVGTDKVLAKLDTPCLEGWITVDNIKELQTYSEKEINREDYPEPVWKGTKFPAALMQQVLGTLHEFPHMETAYSLYYNVTTGEWAVKCPDQNGSGASVSYEDDGSGMPAGFSIIGSIHTHPEMSAFWSGTDLNDQKKKHGIHFVFGLHDGLVRYSLVTVFTPTEQFNQNIHDVVEDFDWAQVYPPVAEWVETIKKQAYRRPVVVYTGKTSVTSYKYNRNKYDWSRYGASGSTSSYAGYSDYDYDDHYGWYGYGDSYNWGDDYDYTPAKSYTGGDLSTTISDALDKDNPYYKVVDEALNSAVKGEQFRKALLSQDQRASIEHELDIVITDTSDKEDIVASVQEISSCIPSLNEPLTADDQSTIFENLFDAMPDVNLVNADNTMSRNVYCADIITNLINGMVDSYCTNPKCLDPDVVGEMLATLKDAYESMLQVQAESEAGSYVGTEEEEQAEC